MNSLDKTVIRNLINSEKELMWRLGRGKYEKIKEVQEVKNTEKRFKLVEGINKDNPPQMDIVRAKKCDDADITRQVWCESVFRHFPHVQYFTIEINK